MTDLVRAPLLVVFGFAAVGAAVTAVAAFFVLAPFVLVIATSLYLISRLD